MDRLCILLEGVEVWAIPNTVTSRLEMEVLAAVGEVGVLTAAPLETKPVSIHLGTRTVGTVEALATILVEAAAARLCGTMAAEAAPALSSSEQ